MAEKHFKSGFAVLAGLPNAGKSTLLNKLAGGLLSPVTSKPQTTRQNILAISEEDNYQVVFVDTPGFLQPRYKLQQTMVNAVDRAVGEEADLVVFMLDASAPYDLNAGLVEKLKKVFCPIFLVINKTDLVPDDSRLKELEDSARKDLPVSRAFCISAAQGKGVDELKQAVIEAMPVSPAYFPPGQWTDRWERFYAAEFIREQIFLLYKKEIPYSTYVEVEKFTEDLGDKNYIRAIIHVERESQKPIIIGKGGAAIAQLRKSAQKRIEEFLGRKYRLELTVTVTPDWRNNTQMLERFGYIVK
ncbi:GTPase Era [Candidatus Avelusimicrobium aviculae]|uniref:GTPase Era n=1 Tax=Candidatus Avelusimicrobium aviculae TaxID=3416206 RepID=UPI003D10D0E3